MMNTEGDQPDFPEQKILPDQPSQSSETIVDRTTQHAAAHNARVWDRMVEKHNRFTRAARDEDFRNPLAAVDAAGWMGPSISGKQILCLAAGGGRQSALYAAAGGIVTVVDISAAMLELDRAVALQRKLQVTTVETSMDDLTMFRTGQFDIVIQPVSSCYLPNLAEIYRQVARITAAGGLYISQHKQPTSLQADIKPTAAGYEIIEPYYRSGPLPNVVGSSHREPGALEYLHRWEELIGSLCRAGFVIEDLVEPVHADPQAARGTFKHRSQYVAPYVRIKARRQQAANAIAPKLIFSS
jgi:SAM-dependent methyltransferase